MAERLVIVSDMWGVKKGLWITSYLGYLQQYFDITFYDCQQLAHLDVVIHTEKNIHQAFENGGIETAATHLLKRETEPAHYLGFSTGGTVAWKANLMGLPMKSLYTVSSTRIRIETKSPECPTTTLFGDNDIYRPKSVWYDEAGVKGELIKGFGHNMYTDEKVIQKVCLDLLQSVTQITKTIQKEKAV
ncbi:hypothetical protein SAMN05421636_103296 [Pricia antarctica]|uniref:Alpha/beta hydrolase n=1 Tax=Pricia antarctica TaxID=641691 RepID=A0A1G7AA09_9FLAO|nr:hypothetical protein [Pricia antarctica]SDE11649.1 hypothetical protein SAMN05421636_103296 [Pricia antarctica]